MRCIRFSSILVSVLLCSSVIPAAFATPPGKNDPEPSSGPDIQYSNGPEVSEADKFSYTYQLIAHFLEEERHRSPEARKDKLTGPHKHVLLSHEELPACEKSGRRLHEVSDHTPGSEKLDVLYYRGDDPGQQKKAEAYEGLKSVYDPNLWIRTDTNRPDVWQLLARSAKIECLPTRFHFVYIGSKRYMEFREGEAAFEAP